MKWLKALFSIAILFVLVCVIAVTALVMFINPNKLKPIIAEAVRKKTGYEVVVEGNFSWSFYPSLGVNVERIAIFMPNQTKPFVDLHNVTFVTQLAELVHGNQKLRGDIYISNFSLLNMKAKDAHIGLHWQNDVLTLQPMIATLYDGTLEGNAQGSHLSNVPRWDWDMKLANIQLRPLLQDVNGPDSKLVISGIGQITLKGGTQGKTRDQLLSKVNGTSEFNLKNGAIEGVDLNYLLKTADALINKQPVVLSENNSNQTAFDSLVGTATIKEGVVATNDLVLTTPVLVAKGAGTINLNFQAINLQLRVSSQKVLNTQWEIPVMVTGDLYRPDVRLDATEVNIMLAKDKLSKVKDKVREEINEHVSGKTGEFLQNLLGS